MVNMCSYALIVSIWSRNVIAINVVDCTRSHNPFGFSIHSYLSAAPAPHFNLHSKLLGFFFFMIRPLSKYWQEPPADAYQYDFFNANHINYSVLGVEDSNYHCFWWPSGRHYKNYMFVFLFRTSSPTILHILLGVAKRYSNDRKWSTLLQ